MKSGYLFSLIILYSLNSLANWKQSNKIASYLKTPAAVVNSALVEGNAPITLHVGVVPKNCYIREDQKASRDLLFLYYNVSDYKYQFDPENISIFIDDVPITHYYSDIIGTHFIEGSIYTVGANYEMNAPFSTLFKKGAEITIQDNKKQITIAKMSLNNSFRSYSNADIKCRSNIQNTYFLPQTNKYYHDERKTLMPMPEELAYKYQKQIAKQNGQLWSVKQNNLGKYLEAPIWVQVKSPNMSDPPYDYYSCTSNINFIAHVSAQTTANEVFSFNYILKSQKTGKEYSLEDQSVQILNPGAYIFLNISSTSYKNIDPKDTYVIKAVGNNAESLTPGNRLNFKLANLPNVLSEIGKDCAQKEAQYNAKVIQHKLNNFPSGVVHPSEKQSHYGQYTEPKLTEIKRWMGKYGLGRSSAYDAVSDAIRFYNSYYDCQRIGFGDADKMSDYELENQIECNKNIAQQAASNGYQSAFNTAKSSVDSIVYELKMRNSNNGFFSGILQGLVGAAAEIAGIEYGQDFSEISNSINSYIRNDSYMIEMNKHMYDVNQYAQRSSSIDSGTSNSSASSGSSSGLRNVNNGNAKDFDKTLSSGNYSCSGPESQNMQAYLGEQMQQSLSQASNNMCAQSRTMADELRKIIPYLQQCAPSEVSGIQDQISYFDNRAQGSCIN